MRGGGITDSVDVAIDEGEWRAASDCLDKRLCGFLATQGEQ